MIHGGLAQHPRWCAEPAICYNSKRGVRNIVIDNLTIAGRKATDSTTANLEIGNFVEDVRFK